MPFTSDSKMVILGFSELLAVKGCLGQSGLMENDNGVGSQQGVENPIRAFGTCWSGQA